MESQQEATLTNVAEMIDTMFGFSDENEYSCVVNFHQLQAILYILAGNLKILGRQTFVDYTGTIFIEHTSRMNLSQVKVSDQQLTVKGASGKKRLGSKESSSSTEDEVAAKEQAAQRAARQAARGAAGLADTSSEESTEDAIGGRAGSPEDATGGTQGKAGKKKGGKGAAGTTENIIIVGTGKDSDRALSIVTRPQFLDMWRQVIALQDKFGPIDVPGFKEYGDLYEEMYKQHDITDPMAILQLSARMQNVEKNIEDMNQLITDWISRIQKPGAAGAAIKGGAQSLSTGGQQESAAGQQAGSPEGGLKEGLEKGLSGGGGPRGGPKDGPKGVAKQGKGETEDEVLPIASQAKLRQKGKDLLKTEKVEETEEDLAVKAMWGEGGPPPAPPLPPEMEGKDPNDLITLEYLRSRLSPLRSHYNKLGEDPLKRVQDMADKTIKALAPYAVKLQHMDDCPLRVNNLGDAIENYTSKISSIDYKLMTFITDGQENITAMQTALEIALENMADALANRKPDTEGILDLHRKFNTLQKDIESTEDFQELLYEDENIFGVRLQDVIDASNYVAKQKADRDEIENAMSTKVGVDQLNGIVSKDQYGAVSGEFEKAVCLAFDKFNSSESYWQKVIDDIQRDSNEKAEKSQIEFFANDMHDKVNTLHSRLDFMLEVVAMPTTIPEKTALERDANCLSCGTKKIEPPRPPPKRSPAKVSVSASSMFFSSSVMEPVISEAIDISDYEDIKTEEKKIEGKKTEIGDGDREICYPTLRVPHKLHPRAKICGRYCGAPPRDKKARGDVKDVSSALHVKALKRDAEKPKRQAVPCIPCQPKKKISVVTKEMSAHELEEMEAEEEVYTIAKRMEPSRAWEAEPKTKEEVSSVDEASDVVLASSYSSFEEF